MQPDYIKISQLPISEEKPLNADLVGNVGGRTMRIPLNPILGELGQLSAQVRDIGLAIGLGETIVVEPLEYTETFPFFIKKLNSSSYIFNPGGTNTHIRKFVATHDGRIRFTMTSTASTTYGRVVKIDSTDIIVEDGTCPVPIVSGVSATNSPLTTEWIDVHAGDIYIVDCFFTRMTIVCEIEYIAASRTPVVLDDMRSDIDANTTKLNTLPLQDKKVAVFGDSSTAHGITEWVARVAQATGAKIYNEAKSGWFLANNVDGLDIKHEIQTFIARSITPDIIIVQMGGNDLRLTGAERGSVESAFANYNYRTLESATTTAECLRYALQFLRDTFPDALILVGTVFERSSGTAELVNTIIRGVCEKLCIQVVDGCKYMGFSPYTEVKSPYYTESGGDPSRANPIFNYINDSTGEVVTENEAVVGGILQQGYSKRYGLYTYDGKHQILRGEKKVAQYWLSELLYHAKHLPVEVE